ncbi:MAG: phosphotransferase [Alistipes sp.]|nr:phosphotransferase [Alistipes sp.]
MKRLSLLIGLVAIVATAGAKTPPEISDDRTVCGQLEKAVRRVISIPDIEGYKTLKCDFHMHTVFADAHVSPTGRVREAWQDGLDVIAMSEHVAVHKSPGIKLKDYNLPINQAVKEGKKWGFLVVPAVEITRTKPFGHMNALFIKDPNVFEETRYKVDENGKLLRDKDGNRIPNPTEMDDFRKAEEQGCFMLWNHPGWPDKKCTLYPLQKQLIKEGRIHAVELFNGSEWYPKVLDWFDEYKLPMMANSDIHDTSRFMYGNQIRPMTLVFAKEYTLESLREALFAGRMLAFFEGKLAGEQKYISQLIDASLKVQVVDEKKGVIVVTNISDIPFQTLFGERMIPVLFRPHSAIRITVPKGTELDFVNCYVGRQTLKKEIW